MNSLIDLWNRISDLTNITSPRRREEKKDRKIIYLLTRKFPNLIKIINLQVQSAQWTLSRVNIKRDTQVYFIVKLLNTKHKNLKRSQRKTDITYRRTKVEIRSSVSSDKGHEEWNDVFKVLTTLSKKNSLPMENILPWIIN